MNQNFQTHNSSLICFISASFELWLSTSSACRFVSTVAGVTVVVAMTNTSLISLINFCSYFTDFLCLKKFNRQLISNFSVLLWRHHNKLLTIGTRTMWCKWFTVNECRSNMYRGSSGAHGWWRPLCWKPSTNSRLRLFLSEQQLHRSILSRGDP